MTIVRSGGLVWLCYRCGDLRLRLAFRTEVEARQWFFNKARQLWRKGWGRLGPNDALRRKP